MSEADIDVSTAVRTQLTEDTLTNYDKIIVMAEPENTPAWLRENPKTEIWLVEDTKGRSMEKARVIRDHIKAKVTELEQRLHEN